MKAAQGGGRVTYYCLVCCHCLARVGKMVKTSFDKSFEKKECLVPNRLLQSALQMEGRANVQVIELKRVGYSKESRANRV